MFFFQLRSFIICLKNNHHLKNMLIYNNCIQILASSLEVSSPMTSHHFNYTQLLSSLDSKYRACFSVCSHNYLACFIRSQAYLYGGMHLGAHSWRKIKQNSAQRRVQIGTNEQHYWETEMKNDQNRAAAATF